MCVSLLLVVLLVGVYASKQQTYTKEEFLSVIRSPGGRGAVPIDFDCAWRTFALEYAAPIQPWLTPTQLSDIHDSLFSGTQCPTAAADALLAKHTPQPSLPVASLGDVPSLYVDYAKGSDSQNGGVDAPFKTIHAALLASRATHTSGTPFAIVLRGGTHFLAATIDVNPLDSGLSFTAYPGETPTISGALPITGLTWTPVNRTTPGWQPIDNNTNAVYGLCPAPTVPDKGVMADWKACQASCQGDATCQAWTFHTPACTGCAGFINHCCWHTDTNYAPTPQVGVVSQRKAPGMNLWSTPLPLPPGLTSLRALQVNGHRATLARFPNANAEIDLFPQGYISASDWVPSTPGPVWNETLTVDLAPLGQEDQGRGVYVNYTIGYGGNAARYDPPRAYWASRDFGPRSAQPTATCDRWEEMHLRSPSGLNTGTSLSGHLPYTHPTSQLMVRTWRDYHWYSWMMAVASVNGSVLTFGEPGPVGGGHQGGEGCEQGDEWWVEGVLDELDVENEYWHDGEAGVLYFFPNSTDANPGDGSPPTTLSLPLLHTFFALYGSQENPVANVSFTGITFTGGVPTFMEPRGQPSGGDWALERLGALLFEGTTGVTVSQCYFTRIDGNAIFLSGYNRYAAITHNEFVWLGQNAVAAWGRTDEWDGTGGQQPRHTHLFGNLAHEIGNIQKQSSFYFQAASCENTIDSNIVYNIPRAAINFDDGFGGANELKNNLLYNTCRESSDHGAFNSWDRMPFVTTVRDGVTPSSIPAMNEFHHSFVVSNYAADGGCLDNDDGSAYYHISFNFCVAGGHKSDFDGHGKVSDNNLHAYSSVYGPRCVDIGAQFLPVSGFAEGYINNTCILGGEGQTVLDIPMQDAFPPHADVANASEFRARFLTGGNKIYLPGGAGKGFGPFATFADFVASGYEIPGLPPSTQNATLPSPDEIIAMARALIFV